MRLWFLLPLLLLAACNVHPAATEVTISAPAPSQEPAAAWLETETDNVPLGMWKPAGWVADTRDGLILIEHTRPSGNPRSGFPHGIVINFFFPELSAFEADGEPANHALNVMEQALAMPDVALSALAYTDPMAFDWHGHEAAYYLLCGSDDVRTLVMGVFLPARHKLLVINVSMAEERVDEVRASLPTLFSGFTVDGVELGGAALDSLPSPLVFPMVADGSA